jgi:hypothetical protein
MPSGGCQSRNVSARYIEPGGNSWTGGTFSKICLPGAQPFALLFHSRGGCFRPRKRIMQLEMRSTFCTLRAGMATAVSLWMAALACIMGCTQPVLAGSPTILDASSIQKNSASHSSSERMADMESCHHSGGNSSVPPSDRKPASNGALSCCPLEITVNQKWSATKLGIARSAVLAPSSGSHFEITRFSSLAEFPPPIWHSGRDTLLKTHLLRI